MLMDAFGKALSNLLLPGMMKLFLLCVVAYMFGCSALAWLMGALLAALVGAPGAEGLFVQALGTVGGGVLAWFLFPLLYPVLVSFFDDYMAEAIERKDYPQLAPASPPFWPTFLQDALFSLKAVCLNILCLPLFLIPLFGQALYFALNGWLLGTQFFRMAAGRRMARPEAEALRKANNGQIFIGGAAISLCATVPVLNLAVPLLGVATMLHLFHMLNGTGKAEIIAPNRP